MITAHLGKRREPPAEGGIFLDIFVAKSIYFMRQNIVGKYHAIY